MRGSDPLDPLDDCSSTIDTDGDGLTDCEEVDRNLNPLDANDVTIQGSGTRGFMGLGGCSSHGSSNTLPWMLLMVVGFLIIRRKQHV